MSLVGRFGRGRLLVCSVGVAGGGLVIVVVRDGSPMWQLARGVAVLLAAAGMAWAVDGERRTGTAVITFAGGVAAAAAGGGIAIPHLAKVGLTLLSGAGLFLVAGGGVLALSGARILTVRSPRWTRLVTVPVLGAAARTASRRESGDEADAARFIRDGSPDSVEVWVVPGAGHTDALDTQARAWEDRVLGFLGDAIGPAG